MHLSADDFLPVLFQLCFGSPWLLFRGVEGIQTCDRFNHNPDLGLSNTPCREGWRSSRDKLLLHLAFPPLPIVYRGGSAAPCSAFHSPPPKLPAGDVFPIDSSHIQCPAFKL